MAVITPGTDMSSCSIGFSKPQQQSDGKYMSKPVEQIVLRLDGLKTLGKIDSNLPMEVTDSRVKDLLQSVDMKCVESAVESSTDWFDKELSQEAVENMFVKSLVIDDEQRTTFPPETFRGSSGVKINVYTNKNTKLDYDKLNEDVNVAVLVELYGIVFCKKSFRIKWKLHQVKVIREIPKVLIDAYGFDDISDDEELS